MAVDRHAAEQAIRAFLKALGHDPETSRELSRTPAFVVEAFERDLLAGYSVDVAALLTSESGKAPSAGPHGLVIVRDIGVATMCPHHLLPGIGKATVAYLPGEQLVGIGAIAKAVDAFARRLTLQETIGDSVVRALVEHAGARGAYCLLNLEHACLAARGARQIGAAVVTVSRAGAEISEASVWSGSRS